MALFGKKKTEEKKVTAPNAGAPVSRDVTSVIVRPIISEKAAILGDKNIYAFEVRRNATKFDVRDAVRKLWNVTPVKVAIVNRAPRTFVVRSKNRLGVHRGLRKAYVYLKEGDRIELV